MLAITPGDHLRGRDLHAWLPALAAAGLRSLSIREPHLDRGTLDAIVVCAERAGLEVWVHIRNPHATSLCRPVHLPATGAAPALPFGQSCHSPVELDRALGRGAAWTLLSPVWSPRSKPDDRRPTLGLDRFHAVARNRPVLALGGVDPDRHARLQILGYGAAACGVLFDHASPEEAYRALGDWPGSQPGQLN